MHIIFLSIIIGLALAMPVGPVTIEMTRRTLRFGCLQGILIGIGASSADVIYMIVMIWGAMQFLHDQLLLKIIGCIGSLILCWFAYQAITHKIEKREGIAKPYSLMHCYSSGFLIAALSPFNILFWGSMTAQIATITHGHQYGIILAALGLFIGTALWFVSLNLTLHITRHRLSDVVVLWLNRIGGIMLFVFALYSLWHVIQM